MNKKRTRKRHNASFSLRAAMPDLPLNLSAVDHQLGEGLVASIAELRRNLIDTFLQDARGR